LFKIVLFLFYISLHAVHVTDIPIYGLLLSGTTTNDMPFHEMSEYYSCYCITKHVLLSFPKEIMLRIVVIFVWLLEGKALRILTNIANLLIDLA